MAGVTHARLQNLGTGNVWERSFRSDLRSEETALDKQILDFLYADGGQYTFKGPDTFEQTEIAQAMIGPQAAFLEPGLRFTVEFI